MGNYNTETEAQARRSSRPISLPRPGKFTETMKKHLKRGANERELAFLQVHEKDLKKKVYWNIYNNDVLKPQGANTTTNNYSGKIDLSGKKVKRKNLAKILKGEEKIY
jgi:hypothetical protein